MALSRQTESSVRNRGVDRTLILSQGQQGIKHNIDDDPTKERLMLICA